MRASIEGRKEQVKRFVKFMEKSFFEFRGEDWRTPQSDFARHLGVDNATLSSWMKGSRLPSPYYVHYLGDPSRLGDAIYNIFPEVRRPMPEDKEAKELLSLFDKLRTPTARSRAVALVSQLLEEQEQEAAEKTRIVAK
jgi:transcriptional regulator with XRE-family HTH domain